MAAVMFNMVRELKGNYVEKEVSERMGDDVEISF